MPLFIGLSGFASPKLSLETSGHSATELISSYSGLFSTVELDSCFTRPPTLRTVQGWCESMPDEFRVSVRVTRQATHVDMLSNPGIVSDLISVLEPLKGRLKNLLFTVPPGMGCDVARIRRVLDVIPPQVRAIWEFRHPSWICPELAQLLREYDSAPALADVSADDAFQSVYFRMRRDVYHPADLMDLAATLTEAGDNDVYVYFKQSQQAVYYVRALEDLTTKVPLSFR